MPARFLTWEDVQQLPTASVHSNSSLYGENTTQFVRDTRAEGEAEGDGEEEGEGEGEGEGTLDVNYTGTGRLPAGELAQAGRNNERRSKCCLSDCGTSDCECTAEGCSRTGSRGCSDGSSRSTWGNFLTPGDIANLVGEEGSEGEGDPGGEGEGELGGNEEWGVEGAGEESNAGHGEPGREGEMGGEPESEGYWGGDDTEGSAYRGGEDTDGTGELASFSGTIPTGTTSGLKMDKQNVKRRAMYLFKQEGGVVQSGAGRPITNFGKRAKKKRAATARRKAIKDVPALSEAQQAVIVQHARSKQGNEAWPLIAKQVQQTERMKAADEAVTNLAQDVGSRHRRGLVRYVAHSIENMDAVGGVKAVANWLACGTDLVYKQIAEINKAATPDGWMDDLPLLTENYATNVTRRRICPYEQELYKQFFLASTSQMSGDRTIVRHLNMQLHELEEKLYAEYPRWLRSLSVQYPTLEVEFRNAKKPNRFQTAFLHAVDALKLTGFDEKKDEELRLQMVRHKYKTGLTKTRMRWERQGAKTTAADVDTMIEELRRITLDESSLEEVEAEESAWEAVKGLCEPVGVKRFWACIKEERIKWTVNVHPHECPLHDQGPGWELKLTKAVHEEAAALDRLEEIRAKMTGYEGDEDAQRLGEDLAAEDHAKKLKAARELVDDVSRYHRHLKQYEAARMVSKTIEGDLKPGQCMVYRDFVNMYTHEGKKMTNLVLVVVYRTEDGGPLHVFKFNNLCTDKNTSSSDAYFVADVFDYYFGKGPGHSTFFKDFSEIFIVGDHGSHFSSQQTVYNESCMWRKYGKTIHIYSLCSYHAYNRCDGAGVEMKRVGGALARAREGASNAREHAFAFNRSLYHNSLAVAYDSINRNASVFENCLEKKEEDEDTLDLRGKCEMHFSYSDEKGQTCHDDGVVLCRDVPELPGAGPGKVPFEVYDLCKDPKGGRACRDCSKAAQAVVRHGEGVPCTNARLLRASATRALHLHECTAGPLPGRITGLQYDKNFKANMKKVSGYVFLCVTIYRR